MLRYLIHQQGARLVVNSLNIFNEVIIPIVNVVMLY